MPPRVTPEWKALTTFGYRSDNMGLGLRWRYQGAVDDVSAVLTPNNVQPGVGVYNLFDLFARFEPTETLELRGGVNNLFDTSLPFVASSQISTDPALYDLIGKAAKPLLLKTGLKSASPELRRMLRAMRLDVQKAQDVAAAVAREGTKLSDAERAAFETALAAARGEYVRFLDSDDWIHPDHLRKLGAKLAAPDRPCVAVVGDGGLVMVEYVVQDVEKATAFQYDGKPWK